MQTPDSQWFYALAIKISIQIPDTIRWPFNATQAIRPLVSCLWASLDKMKYYCTSNSNTARWHSRRSVPALFSTSTAPPHRMSTPLTIIIKRASLRVRRTGSTANAKPTATTRYRTLWLSFAKSPSRDRVRTTGTAPSPSNTRNTTCSPHRPFHRWLGPWQSSAQATWQWWTLRRLP